MRCPRVVSRGGAGPPYSPQEGDMISTTGSDVKAGVARLVAVALAMGGGLSGPGSRRA